MLWTAGGGGHPLFLLLTSLSFTADSAAPKETAVVWEGDVQRTGPGALSHNDKLLRWWLRLMDIWDYFAGQPEE